MEDKRASLVTNCAAWGNANINRTTGRNTDHEEGTAARLHSGLRNRISGTAKAAVGND